PMLNQHVFDGFLLFVCKVDDSAFKFANAAAFNTGLVCDVPGRNTNECPTSSCECRIENIVLCHNFRSHLSTDRGDSSTVLSLARCSSPVQGMNDFVISFYNSSPFRGQHRLSYSTAHFSPRIVADSFNR